MNIKILLFFPFSILCFGCTPQSNEISMACSWVLYEVQSESFVFNLNKEEVYWVNEDQHIDLSEINEGRIVFNGVRSSLKVENRSGRFGGVPVDEPFIFQENVPLTFIIDRVTGNLSIEGIETPAGYTNTCISKDKVI